MIYLLRHGETVWNVAGRLQGHRDSPLTLRGLDQARTAAALLGGLLADPGACRIVASPLGRTWQTAAIVSEELGLDANDIRFDERLREHGFGDWEGLTVDEVARAHPQHWAAREADKWSFQVPGGESYALVAARLRSWLDEQAEEGEVVVVGHGLAGRILRGLYGGGLQAVAAARYEPQDSVFRLAGGVIREFTAEKS